MNVICILALATCGSLRFIVKVPNIEGKVLRQNEKMYQVDFSNDTEAKRYCTDLSKPIFIEKNKCMKK